MAGDRYTDLAALYALDALDGQDLIEFRAHLAAGCYDCATEVRRMQETAALLPATVPQTPPRAEVRERLMHAVGGDTAPRVVRIEEAPRRTLMPAWGWGALAAAAALVLVLGAVSYVLWSRTRGVQEIAERPATTSPSDSTAYWKERYDEQVAAAEAQTATMDSMLATALAKARENEALKPQVAELRRKLGLLEDLNRLLGDPETQVALFSPTDDARAKFAGAAVRVVWNPAKKRAFLLGNDLPQTAGNQVYEMWAIASSGVPVPAGWFRVGPDGIGINSTSEVPAAQLFAVSSEPHGPTEKPTTVVMVSK